MLTLTTNEVAEAAGIWHTQVNRYAVRLGVRPIARSAQRTDWPASLVEAIKQHRRVKDPREGAQADEFWIESGELCIGRRRTDGRRRVLARVSGRNLAKLRAAMR